MSASTWSGFRGARVEKAQPVRVGEKTWTTDGTDLGRTNRAAHFVLEHLKPRGYDARGGLLIVGSQLQIVDFRLTAEHNAANNENQKTS